MGEAHEAHSIVLSVMDEIPYTAICELRRCWAARTISASATSTLLMGGHDSIACDGHKMDRELASPPNTPRALDTSLATIQSARPSSCASRSACSITASVSAGETDDERRTQRTALGHRLQDVRISHQLELRR